MGLKKSQWMMVILGLLGFLVVGTIVWASPPASPPSAPLQSTPGLDADKVDGKHAVASWLSPAQRSRKLLWASADGYIHWSAIPAWYLDGLYVNDDRSETISAAVGATENVLNVVSTAASGSAIRGQSTGYHGVRGTSTNNHGVHGSSTNSVGVYGYSSAIPTTFNEWTPGVYGRSLHGAGVYGRGVDASSGIGVVGHGQILGGVFVSYSYNIIEGWQDTDGDDFPDARRFRVDVDGDVYADRAYHCGLNDGGSALYIDENSGCMYDNSPADFAEVLPVANDPEPGDVLVIGADGRLSRSTEPYQSSVLGVYSAQPSYVGGAANLGKEGYAPLAVIGLVPVKASAENGAIGPGDLLVTSSTPGHAMKASPVDVDGVQIYRPGTIIGKALEPLDAGTGLILMLVTLQ